MKKLIINQSKIANPVEFSRVCPFGALEEKNGVVTVNSACRMCGVCVKASKNGEAVFEEITETKIDKSLWSGIAVFACMNADGSIHPVTFELLGRASQLAAQNGGGNKVYCLVCGSNVKDACEELAHWFKGEIYFCEDSALEHFRMEPYTAVFEKFINEVKPAAVLVGATPEGRQLAPRVAARFKTGLTADCTTVEIEENTDLSQIRPAFGGNIMAHIVTPNHRPQMATVRYKVMNMPARMHEKTAEIKKLCINGVSLFSGVEVLEVIKKEKVRSIEQAQVIVAIGRGVKSKDDIGIFLDLANALGGELGCSRPLVENGFCEAYRQIGLSGRTVRPKLIIACGISGAVQFAAGMKGADRIIAINNDKNAPIFDVAHYCVVGDIYSVVPALTERVLKYGTI